MSGVPFSVLYTAVVSTVFATSHAVMPAPSPKHPAFSTYASRSASTGALCEIVGDSNRDAQVQRMVRSADAIIVAVAQRAATANELSFAGGFLGGGPVPGGVVFSTVQVLRGKPVPDTVVIMGELTEKDDFNTFGVPYPSVRPSGGRGSCFAEEYRRGAEYLLFLHRDEKGRLTPYWWPLLPANEQLHPPRDLWLAWVRSRIDEEKLRR